MLKKKAFNRIFFATIIFFITFTFYNLRLVLPNNKEAKTKIKTETIYTINKDNYVSKAEVYVGKVFTLEDKIKEKLEIMIKDNNKNSLLPSYFNPILPENTKVLNVEVEDSIVKVYFSKELQNINKEQSEKMIESIVYTITDEDILGIEIYVENELLKYVPHTKKELPTILTKDFGINKIYNINSTNNITKTVMLYYTDCGSEYYEIPITEYSNDNREKLEIIFDNLLMQSPNKNLINLLEDVQLINYRINKKEISINLNKDIDEEEINLIVSSIFDNYNIQQVSIYINNQKKYEKTEKNIEK